MQISVYNINWEEVDQIEVSEDIFNVPFNEALVHQVMVGQHRTAA